MVCLECGKKIRDIRPASPPHAAAERCKHGVRWQDSCRACAAAEPEKLELSIAEMVTIGDVMQAWAHRPVRQAQELYLAGKRAAETPLYAAEQQPIARERVWIENNLRRLISLHKNGGGSGYHAFYESIVAQLAHLDRACGRDALKSAEGEK